MYWGGFSLTTVFSKTDRGLSFPSLREPTVLLLRPRPHGPILSPYLWLPEQPHSQCGSTAYESTGTLRGRAAVCQPPAIHQQQPYSPSQAYPREWPGQQAFSSQRTHGRGEKRMRMGDSSATGLLQRTFGLLQKSSSGKLVWTHPTRMIQGHHELSGSKANMKGCLSCTSCLLTFLMPP